MHSAKMLQHSGKGKGEAERLSLLKSSKSGRRNSKCKKVHCICHSNCMCYTDYLLNRRSALEVSEAESKQHLDKIEELEQSLFELGGEIGAGRHVPPGVRVLSLKDNPEQQWVDLRQAAMDRLKGENEALMKRLRELEESGVRGGAGDGGKEGEGEELVPRKSWELANKEKKELEEVVRQKEKRLLRLQQVKVTFFDCLLSTIYASMVCPCRYSVPRAPSSEKPLLRSLGSSSHSTTTGRCG